MYPCIINDEISQTLDDSLELCEKHRFRSIEIRSVENTPPHLLSAAQCKEIVSKVTDLGMHISALSSPVFKSNVPVGTAQIAECEDLLKRSIERCVWLGTGTMRIFSFFRAGQPDLRIAADAMNSILSSVDTADTNLAIESGTLTNCPTAALAQELLDKIEQPNVGVLWDPGNSIFSGFGTGKPLGGLEDLSVADLMHVHIKDPRGTAEYVKLGYGDLDWRAILASLSERGYQGAISLETHWRIGRTLSADERNTPWGSLFSDGGYDASDICMGVLAGWFQDLNLRLA